MSKQIVIASDLDETLLNDTHQVSEYTKDVIHAAIEKGFLFVPCTSRGYTSLPKSLLETNVRYFICANGAAIWDKKENNVIYSCLLDYDIAMKSLKIASDYVVARTFVTEGRIHSEKIIRDIFGREGFDKTFIEELLSTRVLIDNAEDSITPSTLIEKVHINFLHPEERLLCKQRIDAMLGYESTSSSAHNIEITNPNADKGQSLLKLCDILNITDRTIYAFGDNLNDAALLKVADVSIAVNNALPTLKEVADVISEYKNHEDAVAKYVQSLF